jgi:hypothetical protein
MLFWSLMYLGIIEAREIPPVPVSIVEYSNDGLDNDLSSGDSRKIVILSSKASPRCSSRLKGRLWSAGGDRPVAIEERRAAISFRDTRVSHSARCVSSRRKTVECRRPLFTPARVRSSFYKVINVSL